jgi:Big-like domain-containing protein
MRAKPAIRAQQWPVATVIAVAVMVWIGGCEHDRGCPTCTSPLELPLILSDTTTQPTADLSTSQEPERFSVLGSSQGSAAGSFAYVSLPPGAVPDAVTTTIRNRATGSTVTVPMVDGGFDPVAIDATAGDVLELEIQFAGASPPLRLERTVPGRRPPRVVRTNPPPKKRDVSLNSSMMIVFSEPVDEATVTNASVQLMRGTTPVEGRLEFRDGEHLVVAFVPRTALTPGSDYRLVVTQTVRDRDGESLEASVTVDFSARVTPGTSASVVRVPEDAATIQEGVDFVATGGVVRVRAGTYPEAIEINKGLTIEAATETDAVVITPSNATLNAIGITTTEPVILRRLTIDHLGLAPGTDHQNTAVVGTGRANVTILESDLLRANNGVYIENDSAVTGGRARLVIRNSIVDGGESSRMEVGVFAVTHVDAVIADNVVRRTTFSCIQIQGRANADVTGNDVDMCGPVGGIRAPMYGSPKAVVNIIGNTVRNSAGSASRVGIFLAVGRGVIERNTVIAYVRSSAEPSIDAAGIRVVNATAIVRFNDISGNSYAGLRHDGPSSLDATCNWWGSADGPSGAGGGSGDAVVGVASFVPFATAPIAQTEATSCSGQAAQATQLAFTVQPTSTVLGRAIAPMIRVSARDAQGKPTTSFTGQVALALAENPGGATIDGSRIATAVNGVATFPDVRLTQAGSGYVLAASAAGLTTAASTAFDVTAQSPDAVYFNDFEADVGPEWSYARRSTVPNASYSGRAFLGNFGCSDYHETDTTQTINCRAADLVALSLTGLPAHGEVTITLDLYLIRTWDGNPAYPSHVAPDVFNVSVAGGPTLLNATFAVHPNRRYQSYPAAYPTDGSDPPNNARHTGALEVMALGYDMDAVYRLTLTFAHSQPAVTFRFTAPHLQHLDDESWGLDNVEVKVARP